MKRKNEISEDTFENDCNNEILELFFNFNSIGRLETTT